MERYLNHPFLKYAEKLGYERCLAVNTLKSLGDNMTTDSMLEAVLKSYEASLPRSTEQWLYYQTLGRPAFSINFDRFQILYIMPECNIRNPNHPIYLALESALHNLTPGGYYVQDALPDIIKQENKRKTFRVHQTLEIIIILPPHLPKLIDNIRPNYLQTITLGMHFRHLAFIHDGPTPNLLISLNLRKVSLICFLQYRYSYFQIHILLKSMWAISHK